MVARIDKYDPVSGGFRARIGWAPVSADVGKVYPVYIDNAGKAQKGSATQCDGVLCLSSLVAQGDVIDVMTDGEIVDIDSTTSNITSPAAGALLRTQAAGAVATAGTGPVIGRMVENWRLVVRVGRAWA